jgi:hypothetical protein
MSMLTLGLLAAVSYLSMFVWAALLRLGRPQETTRATGRGMPGRSDR